MLKINNLIGLGASSRQPFPAQGNLVGFWKFDEGLGTTAFDSSPSGKNGTLTSSGLWTPNGKINSAIQGDGTNYVALATDINLFSLGAAHSIMGWLYLTNTNDNAYVASLSFRSSSGFLSTNHGQAFIYLGSTGGLQARRITDSVTVVGSIRGGYAPGIYLQAGWNCVAMARGVSTMEIYAVDAAGTFHEASTESTGTFNFTNGNPLNMLGAYSGTSTVLPSGRRLDMPAIFNTQITKADFLAYYNFNKGNFI